ncbi:MAG: poly(3-hydroxybutyrate) depolymerase [Pseudomonadota bacterium]
MGPAIHRATRSALRLSRVVVTAVAGLACTAGAPAKALPPLPALGIDIAQTSTSGISSGAYMAGQFQMAHGEIVVGAAIIAGGPYGCAQSAFSAFSFGSWGTALNFNRAANGCMLGLMRVFGVPSARVLVRRAERLAAAGEIAPLETIRRDRVYLFTGTKDVIVNPAIMQVTNRFYRALGVPAGQLAFEDSIPAGHAFVTETEGGACGLSVSPFVVDCDFDLAGRLLAHIYGPLKPRGDLANGRFVSFSQKPSVTGFRRHGLAAEGRAFIPDDCRRITGCRVHVAFHGCLQNRAAAGDAFVGRTGLANWAVTNRIVVLFPQTRASPDNPQGCWDWWGFTGRDFLTRKAPQIEAIHRMLQTLAAKPAK